MILSNELFDVFSVRGVRMVLNYQGLVALVGSRIWVCAVCLRYRGIR